MYFSKVSVVSFGLLATSSLVAGHAAVIKAVGDAGGQGSAIGVDPNTPRDGTRRDPFQQDSTRFKGDAAATCGETLGQGANDIQAGTKAVMAQNGATLPQVSAGGALMMTVHQVNGDGAGPYTCMIDATGTGTNWTAMQVTTNLDGNARGRNNANQMMDLPLNVAIAADQTCTGTVAGQSNVCMVRCQNPARAGPFGGCVPVQMNAAGTAAAPAAAGAAAPVAAAPQAAAPQAVAPQAVAPQAVAPQAATPQAGVAGTTAPAAAAQAPQAPQAQGAAGVAPQAATGATPQAAGAAGIAPAAQAAGAVPQTGATGAIAPQAVAPAAAGNAAGATAATKREAKKDRTQAATPQLTDDDQEEEVDLLGNDVLNARYVVPSN